jgi:hypothetical protein
MRWIQPAAAVMAAATLSLATALCVALPTTLSAQGVGVGVRAGTAGVGVDVGVTVLPPLTLRAGLGSFPYHYETTVDGIEYRVGSPGVHAMVGADLNLLGPLRLTGGLLYRSEPFEGRARVEAGTEVGDYTVPEDGTIDATLGLRRVSPFLGIGFGRLTAGFGLYADLAVAHSGDPDLRMRGSANLESTPGFQENLERERQRALDELPSPVLYPLLQVGVRFGVGF